jgi:hypothetical protein
MSRKSTVASIATTIGDYRHGAVAPLDEKHIERWVSVFDDGVQLAILTELDHVLSRTYISHEAFSTFFSELITNQELVGDDPPAYWKRANFFNKQIRGGSQAELLKLFDGALQQHCGFGVTDCGSNDGPIIYLDDAVYTGMHVINDLKQVIPDAQNPAKVILLIYAAHTQGLSYATSQLTSHFRAAGKKLEISCWCEKALENSAAIDSDVLWPKSLPEHEPSKQYYASLTKKITLRSGDSVGKNALFSSAAGRHLLEQEFLKRGAVIKAENQNLKTYARPLGNVVLQSFGFGALIVTYRNCSNNCPLVF